MSSNNIRLVEKKNKEVEMVLRTVVLFVGPAAALRQTYNRNHGFHSDLQKSSADLVLDTSFIQADVTKAGSPTNTPYSQ